MPRVQAQGPVSEARNVCVGVQHKLAPAELVYLCNLTRWADYVYMVGGATGLYKCAALSPPSLRRVEAKHSNSERTQGHTAVFCLSLSIAKWMDERWANNVDGDREQY